MLCWWLSSMGLYTVALPGAFVGLGCGTLSRTRSIPLCVFCAVAGCLIGFYAEWWNHPFLVDKSFNFFINNLSGVETTNLVVCWIGIHVWQLGLDWDANRWSITKALKMPKLIASILWCSIFGLASFCLSQDSDETQNNWGAMARSFRNW